MKLTIAIALAAVLMFGTAMCMAVSCNFGVHDECCPKAHAVTSCPYDILAAAKAPKPQIVGVAATPAISLVALEPVFGSAPVAAIATDGRDLYSRCRVLRL
ncbi:MAG TPA: hypothetical protein VKS01_01965 [Bryobacteraceae bacterium]|nr:hypothetical protein [Bryobacteraceae bacterium]